MGANKSAFVALNAGIGIPDGDLKRDIAFFVLGGAYRESAIFREDTDGQARRPRL